MKIVLGFISLVFASTALGAGLCTCNTLSWYQGVPPNLAGYKSTCFHNPAQCASFCGGQSTSWAPSSPSCKNAIGVSATTGWQPTRFHVNAGETVTIAYTVGRWCGDIDGASQFHRPDKPESAAAIRGPADPCPGAMEDSLCGRIGSETFWVGTGTTHKASQSGELQLTINDRGYYDNAGTVWVNISK